METLQVDNLNRRCKNGSPFEKGGPVGDFRLPSC